MKRVKFSSSSKNSYFYDNETGIIFPETEVSNIDNLAETQEAKPPFATEKDVSEYIAINGYKQLLLEVTEVCNLRCKYCTYSDHYVNTRGHGEKFMTFDVAKKAVDFYMSNFIKAYNRNPLRKPVISFYGGEPLVNFNLIKDVVEYFNANYPDFTPDYNVTTNGLLLSEEVNELLAKNNFSVIVSLDGDKENHDRNRVKMDGSGTFDEVYGNIIRFKEKYPNHAKIGISTCYDYDTDLQKISDFMKENDLFVVLANMISSQETDYYRQFTNENVERFNHQVLVMRQQYFDLAKEKGILLSERSFLLSLFAFGYIDFTCHPVFNEKKPAFLPYTGSCVPGEKIYVTVNGDLHMCERISPFFSIGNVDTGLAVAKIVNYMNKFNEFYEKCSKCDISRLCDICLARATDSDEISLPINYCNNRRKYIEETLVSYVDLMEAKPDQIDRLILSYYDNVRDITGNIFD